MAGTVIATCSFEEAEQYRGKVLTSKVDNKKVGVMLSVSCDDFSVKQTIELARGSKNIIMLDYVGTDNSQDYLSITKEELGGVYLIKEFELGDNVTEEEVQDIVSRVPQGVVAVINLPESYNDLRSIHTFCRKYPNVRFSGGTLFDVEGVSLGKFGIDILEANDIKYAPTAYLSTEEPVQIVPLETLEVEASMKAEKSARGTISGNGSRGKKQLQFSALQSRLGYQPF